MQALRIHAHGGPEVLSLDSIPQPEPGAGEVLVRVLATSINHLDLWVRRGMPGFPVGFPRILGCDGIGEVAELGSGVSGLELGQRVLLEPGYTTQDSPELRAGMDHLAADYSVRGEHGDGFHAEYVVLSAQYCLPLPANTNEISAESLAAVPLVYLTAWGMLMTRAKLQPGECVLVLGGASGVGSAAIQIAKDLGARVLATAGSEAKRELAHSLGADEVIDHRAENWGKEIKALTDGRGVDVVFEHVGPATWRSSMGCLARNGRLVTCGGTTGAKVELLLPHVFIKNLSILGSTMGPKSALPGIFQAVGEGRYRPVLDRAMPLSEAARAHELLEAREVLGKLVLIPGQ